MKTALITGVTGQDGAYLAEYLIALGYRVWGLKRRSSLFNTDRIDHLIRDEHEGELKFNYLYGDLTDASNLIRVVQEIRPDEIYNLAAMSHVKVSFDTPEYTGNADGLGTLRILEAVRLLGMTKTTRVYQASTSELFGKVQETPQSETTPFYPRSPYACAKLYAYWITVNYREAYGMYASNGILFNHESPLRGETFVTRKITRAVARIAHGMQERVYLGNLDSKRDWGHARDYVEGMHAILQHREPDDFVLATGVTTQIREFVRRAFREVGIEIDFSGAGAAETGRIGRIDAERFRAATGRRPDHLHPGATLVAVDPIYFRPTEVDLLLGDASKAKRLLGWTPKRTLDDIVREMVASDVDLIGRDRCLAEAGFKVTAHLEENA